MKPTDKPDQAARDRAAADLPVLDRYLKILGRVEVEPLARTRLEAWCQAAIDTHLAKKPTELVCRNWSEAADSIIRAAWAEHPDLSTCTLFALGKLGAEELNLSSDIDLVAVAPDGAPPPVIAFREFVKRLSMHTESGFLFRVDLAIRPGGKSSTVLPTTTEFINHFLLQGEAWERLAWIRARVLAAPQGGRSEVEDFLSRYIFRRHLDFTVIEELRALRGRNRAELKAVPTGMLNIKLGPGGIREIETYLHSLAAIHGGRRPSLRTRSTTLLIRALQAENLISHDDADFLDAAYWTFRHHENLAQAREDLQTYLIPESGELLEMCRRVDWITSQFFQDRPTGSGNLPSLDELTKRGFDGDEIREPWSQLLAGRVRSRHSERDETSRRLFLSRFLDTVERRGVDRTLAVHLLCDFEKALRAKATFYELMNRHPQVADTMAEVFSVSPFLGGLLARRPELVDAWLLRRDEPFEGDLDEILGQMVDRRLLVELLAASDLLMTQNLERLHANLSACADEICLALLEHLEREDPATQVSILALGKWGSRELGLQSDLDFVFVTRQPLTEAHHRRCRRFLSLLSAAHPGGRLYSYDMRLRPSGHAGPLLLEIGELQRFLELKAEAWQRQAHLRARWIGPATGVGMPAISLRQVDDGELGQLSLIRSQLIVEAETVGSIDLKAAPGGLIDCEFTAQIALLREAQSVPLAGSTYLDLLDLLAQRSSDWAEARPRLLAGYNRLRRVEQTYHLVCESGGTKIKLGGREWERLRRKAETNGDDLAENLRNELRDLKQLNASLRESRAK